MDAQFPNEDIYLSKEAKNRDIEEEEKNYI